MYYENEKVGEVTALNEEFSELDIAPEKQKKPSDPKLCILMLQITACLILATIAISIKFFGGEFYTELRGKYIEMFEDDTTVEEVFDSLAGRFDGTSSIMASSYLQTSSGEPQGTPAVEDGSAPSSAESDAVSAVSDSSVAAPEENSSSGGEVTTSEPIDSSAVTTSAAVFDFDNIARTTAISSRPNSLYMPVVGVVSSEYGHRVNPVTGIYTLHSGIDFAADTGTPVYSALAGRVTEVEESSSYGIYVTVEHEGGIETLYAHLSAAKTRVGAVVKKGDRIGLVGNTGRSTGPHLHFEVSVSGCKLNPRFLLPELSLS